MGVVMQGLEEAFTYFGGVPRELLFDQMKGVVLEDHRMKGGRLISNPEFLRFAHHWGFVLRACRPYRAKTKGKVERPIRFVRDSFVYGREFLGDADLDTQRAWWLDDSRMLASTPPRKRSRAPVSKSRSGWRFTLLHGTRIGH